MRSLPANHRRSGFTLIELLVVIAIIAILAAILFPIFAQARAKARAAACLSNMKQISIGVLMYCQDYDDTLPEPGLQGVFRNATDSGLGQLYLGMLPYHLAIQPYVKNYQVFACLDDDNRLNASIDRSDMTKMLAAAGVPTSTFPAYSNTCPYHQAIAQVFPMSYASNYILDACYAYVRRDNGATVPGSDAAGAPNRGEKGRVLSELGSPASTWFMTEYGSVVDAQGVTNTCNAGWYTTPGYLNTDANQFNRWRLGRRHNGGRHWMMCDGHVKWIMDPPFFTTGTTPASQAQIQAYYDAKQIYTTPN